MKVLWLLVGLFLVIADGEILMEITFDLALNQETDTGYTASHTVSEYLQDKNLLWMRYFHTLVTGQPGNAPMRVAWMQFQDFPAWTRFEKKNMEATHILFDLFWINWRRTLWVVDDTPTSVPKRERQQGQRGGFVFCLKMAIQHGKEKDFESWNNNFLNALAKELENNEGFIERRAYKADTFQGDYQLMTTYEFTSVESLARTMLGEKASAQLEQGKKFLSEYSSSVLAPSADAQGGQIFKGAGFPN